MNAEKLEQWIQRNGTGEKEIWYSNGLTWLFVTLRDGWIAIFERENPDYYRPAIQSLDLEHAKSYCAMIEPVTFPLQVLCP